MVKALAQDLAIAHNDAAHSRIRRGGIASALGLFERQLQIVSISLIEFDWFDHAQLNLSFFLAFTLSHSAS